MLKTFNGKKSGGGAFSDEDSISKGSEAREDRVSSENTGPKGEGEQGARCGGECGVNGKGLAFLLGMKGGVAGGHLPVRSIGGYGSPPKEGTSWRHHTLLQRDA